MREYKFRAWHEGYPAGVDPQMLYDSTPGDCLKWKAEGQKIAAIMQWTGLTDRNGKDVYEGDILKIADDADEFITNGTVEWLHDFWNVSEIEDSLYGLTRNGYVEVIGNKFTHPELINS